MKRRAYRTPVLCAYAFFFSAGSFNAALSEERLPSPLPVSSDGKIASLLMDIENALMTGGMATELSDKLIEARTLWSTASLDGRRMLIEFPDRLQKDQARLPNDEDETKLINLRVFGRVAAQYIEDAATPNNRQPVEPPAHVSNVPDQVAIVAPTAPPQVTTPPPPPPKPESVATSPPQIRPSQTTIALLDRGNSMFALGDITAARLLFQRATELGSGRAAMKLANTYDPDFIGGHNVIGIQPDQATAAIWYRKAVALGEPQANERFVVMVERLSHQHQH
jgi:hypothetical protein